MRRSARDVVLNNTQLEVLIAIVPHRNIPLSLLSDVFAKVDKFFDWRLSMSNTLGESAVFAATEADKAIERCYVRQPVKVTDEAQMESRV